MKRTLIVLLTLVVLFSFVACDATKQTYTITYDYGYKGADNKQLFGQVSITKPETPLKDGYVFLYWDLNGEPFNEWNQELTNDITLTAIWGKALNSSSNLPLQHIDNQFLPVLTEYYVLQDNLTSTATLIVPKGTTATLDLNGFKIDCPIEYQAISNRGNFTILDSSKEKTGIICNSLQNKTQNNLMHHLIYNNSVLTINGGTFGDCDNDRTNENKANLGSAIYNYEGTVTINDGNFSCRDGSWKLNSEDTDFSGHSYALINVNGNMTINNCNLYGKMRGGISSENKSNVIIHDGNYSITGDDSEFLLATGAPGQITVSGGDFTKTGSSWAIIGTFNPTWNSEDLTKNGFILSGGTFIKNGFQLKYY